MNKQIIQVPPGVRYLSQWKEFDGMLPNEHFILNKRLTGAGATYHFLTNEEDVVLCSPRISLIESKKNEHSGDVCFYRDMQNAASPDASGKSVKSRVKKSSILSYKNDVKAYIAYRRSIGRSIKIMVTYDSLGHIIDVLKSVGISGSEITLVIDEFQCIFTDASFKSLTEMTFLDNARYFTKAIFLSATPYLESYMDKIPQFQNMPYMELEWPEDMVKPATVHNIKMKRSVTYTCCGIIGKMKSGKTIQYGAIQINTTEAVFYINSVSDICRIIKKSGLEPSEVNVLCARDDRNVKKLEAVGHVIGSVPKRGETLKMFTFCTRTTFLGVDFYSECAYSFVFADPKVHTLSLDISTDLPQIIGRQRLDSNPYRNEAILFYKSNSIGLDEDSFNKYVEDKRSKTDTLIQSYNAMTPDAQKGTIPKYRASIEKDRYKDDYLTVVDDKNTGCVKVEFNQLVMLAEIRSWEIRKNNFTGSYSILCQQSEAGLVGTIGTATKDPEVIKFLEQYNKLTTSIEKIKSLCDFLKDHPELIDELDFIPQSYKDYWEALGYDEIVKLGFQKSKIESVMSKPRTSEEQEKIIVEVRKQFERGRRYNLTEVKSKLKEIYKSLGVQKAAKANDIEEYIPVKEGRGKDGRFYTILSLDSTVISTFKRHYLPNHPQNMDIADVLKTMKEGSQVYDVNLKAQIESIRKESSHDEQNKLKKELPGFCPNGTFSCRDKHGLVKYSSLIVFDYDGLDDADMEEVMTQLKSVPHTYAVFVTPSGKGLKAIVLHDSLSPRNHKKLFEKLKELYDFKGLDKSVKDIARFHYFSYDPNLWENPDCVPYHFEEDDTIEKEDDDDEPKQEVIIKKDSDVEVYDIEDDMLKSFLRRIWNQIMTDDAVILRLDKHFKAKHPEYFKEGNRHRSMLIISGIFCKVAIPYKKAKEYLMENYPGIELSEIEDVVAFAYEHNSFGSDRWKWK